MDTNKEKHLTDKEKKSVEKVVNKDKNTTDGLTNKLQSGSKKVDNIK
ncbi:hypothetical protein BH09BAC1_BH09BAC1_12840 [soil metagenome]